MSEATSNGAADAAKDSKPAAPKSDSDLINDMLNNPDNVDDKELEE